MGFINVRPLDEHLPGSEVHRALLDAAPVAVLMVDPASDHVVWCSEGAAALLETDRPEIESMSIDDLLGDAVDQWRSSCLGPSHAVRRLELHRAGHGQRQHLEVLTRLAPVEGRDFWLLALHRMERDRVTRRAAWRRASASARRASP